MRIALIGLGNILFCDEGVGLYLAKYIESNYESSTKLDIVDGGLLGFWLMRYFDEYDAVIIVGASSYEKSPGDITIDDKDMILQGGQTRKSANEAELVIMLEVATLAGMDADVKMIGMVPEDTVSVANALSKTLIGQFNSLLDATLDTLREYGVVLSKKDTTISIESIIHSCANPKITLK